MARKTLYEYDEISGRLTAVTSPEGRVEYGTDKFGRLINIKSTTGVNTDYIYDNYGRLSKVVDRGLSLLAAERAEFEYKYDKFDRKTAVHYPNGAGAEYKYFDAAADAAYGSLKSITHKGAPVTPGQNQTAQKLLEITYTRAKSGQIEAAREERFENGAVLAAESFEWAYGYDGLKRLTGATRRTKASEYQSADLEYGYGYSSRGNRVSKTINGSTANYTYNSLDQLISGDGKTYRYDRYGRQISETAANGESREYAYNVDDTLSSVAFRNSAREIVQSVGFTYDHQGTRTGRSVSYGSGGEGSLAPDDSKYVRYLTDYQNLTGYSQTLSETDKTGGRVRANYFYGDSLLAQRTARFAGSDGISPTGENIGGPEAPGNDALAFFHTDHLGSTRLLTGSSGTVISDSTFNYEPYGSSLNGNSSLTNYMYTGQHLDKMLGLQYHRARWLNTSTARWLSTDPVFDMLNFGNPYSYVGGNVLKNKDVSGMIASLAETVAVLGCVTDLVSTEIDGLYETFTTNKSDYINGSDVSKYLAPLAFVSLIFNIIQLGIIISAAIILLIWALPKLLVAGVELAFRLVKLFEKRRKIPKDVDLFGGTFLFRGTEDNYPSSSYERTGMTPTTEDPSVATAFSSHLKQSGVADDDNIVIVVRRKDIEGEFPPEELDNKCYDFNLEGQEYERQVLVAMDSPSIQDKAQIVISHSDSIKILKEMGIEVPQKIANKSDLTNFLKNSPKMTDIQIKTFIQKAAKVNQK